MNTETEGAGFKNYCLGTGCMEKCKTCQHGSNWQKLNQMPDNLRKATQALMMRVDESYCQISSGSLYAAIKAKDATP